MKIYFNGIALVLSTAFPQLVSAAAAAAGGGAVADPGKIPDPPFLSHNIIVNSAGSALVTCNIKEEDPWFQDKFNEIHYKGSEYLLLKKITCAQTKCTFQP
jgi:hypothetical protein